MCIQEASLALFELVTKDGEFYLHMQRIEGENRQRGIPCITREK